MQVGDWIVSNYDVLVTALFQDKYPDSIPDAGYSYGIGRIVNDTGYFQIEWIQAARSNSAGWFYDKSIILNNFTVVSAPKAKYFLKRRQANEQAF
jgi:hypothetical protein